MAPQTHGASQAVSAKSAKQHGTSTNTAAPWTPGPLGCHDAADPNQNWSERQKRILKQYRDMIDDARRQGKQVAADNLEHWLSGTGNDRHISAEWLRKFSVIISAEETNRKRFEEKTVAPWLLQFKDGYTGAKQDYWDTKLTASVWQELYYASGTSTITSRGKFAAARHGDWVHVVGMVEHHWWDPYDWHADLGAWIPGHGNISDADALELESLGCGAAFGMYSFWHETLVGKYGIDTGWFYFDQEQFKWGPVKIGRAGGIVSVHHVKVESAGDWPLTHDAMTDNDKNPLPGLSQRR